MDFLFLSFIVFPSSSSSSLCRAIKVLVMRVLLLRLLNDKLRRRYDVFSGAKRARLFFRFLSAFVVATSSTFHFLVVTFARLKFSSSTHISHSVAREFCVCCLRVTFKTTHTHTHKLTVFNEPVNHNRCETKNDEENTRRLGVNN